MKELKSIVTAYEKINFTERRAAIATVVRVRGSSYRSPGARMLITDDGRWVGSISGGCLEGDALRKARLVMETRHPLLITYDTREESNQSLGVGLGCNGVIDVLIEPIDGTSDATIDLFRQVTTANRPQFLATFINPSALAGKKILLNKEFEPHDALSVSPIEAEFYGHIKRSHSGRSEIVKFSFENNEVEVFMEFIQPSISLIIFGGGFDARPVSQLAHSLGWSVTVTDECAAHIAPVFFPAAEKLSLCSRAFVDRNFPINTYTACVLMSHNYDYDRDVLRKLLDTDTPYIGILGPAKRYEKMRKELQEAGVTFRSGDAERIHAPIGIDIGAESPDEIALSIVAEIQSKFAGRSGGFLKYRRGPIHAREHGGDQVFKQVFLIDPDVAQSEAS